MIFSCRNVAILLIASPLVLGGSLLLGICAAFMQYNSVSEFLYRVSTSAKAAYTVLNFSDEEVNNFMQSLVVFDKDMISTAEDATKVRHYYHVLNHLCAIGDVEKMYIPPALDMNLGVYSNQRIFEENFSDILMKGAQEIQARETSSQETSSSKQRFLETGCGRGRIAHHVASYTGQHVTGYNLDPSQVSYAKQYAEQTNMADSQLNFFVGDHNRDPFAQFGNGTFHGVYNVQAWTYVTDHTKFMSEVYRVLKPGGYLSTLEWVVLPNFNGDDLEHRRMMQATKTLIGAVRNPVPKDYIDAMERVGFEITFSHEASTNPEKQQWPLTIKLDNYFTTVVALVDFLVRWRLLPKHVKLLMDRLVQDGQLFVAGDKLGLFTSSWHIVARKPFAK